MKKYKIILICLVLVLLSTCLYAYAGIVGPVAAHPKYSVTVYAGPSTSYSSLYSVNTYNTVYVLEKEGSYYYIEYGNKRGYVPSGSLEPASSSGFSDVPYVSYNYKSAKIIEGVSAYYGGSSNYDEIGSVDTNEKVSLLKNDNDYAYIEYTVSSTRKKKRGYVPCDNVIKTNIIVNNQNNEAYHCTIKTNGNYLDSRYINAAEKLTKMVFNDKYLNNANYNYDYYLFGEYDSTYGYHEGIDVNDRKYGTEIYSLVTGDVVNNPGGSYGMIFIYDDSDNVTYIYEHCINIKVKKDDKVYAGKTIIAEEGDKGAPGNCHVHVQVVPGKRTYWENWMTGLDKHLKSLDPTYYIEKNYNNYSFK